MKPPLLNFLAAQNIIGCDFLIIANYAILREYRIVWMERWGKSFLWGRNFKTFKRGRILKTFKRGHNLKTFKRGHNFKTFKRGHSFKTFKRAKCEKIRHWSPSFIHFINENCTWRFLSIIPHFQNWLAGLRQTCWSEYFVPASFLSLTFCFRQNWIHIKTCKKDLALKKSCLFHWQANILPVQGRKEFHWYLVQTAHSSWDKKEDQEEVSLSKKV